MNKHTTLPNLMQKLVSDEEIQLIAEAVGYRDSYERLSFLHFVRSPFFLWAASSRLEIRDGRCFV
ncbi:hypothetical protein B9L21_14140 [Geobacillus uzenensis]|uniref:Uncharacterized protein n=1 Tax=Geobacillus uzenensis TaxID=129339 RepID=A0ABX4DF34_9BACL|nr:hypothetical protein B9L21_14140 [Geobacillus uzenensis]